MRSEDSPGRRALPDAFPFRHRCFRAVRRGRAGRTLLFLAGEDIEGGWRSMWTQPSTTRNRTSCSSGIARSGQGAHRLPRAAAIRHVDCLSVYRRLLPDHPSREYRARHSQGLRTRFEHLLFGNGAVISEDAALHPGSAQARVHKPPNGLAAQGVRGGACACRAPIGAAGSAGGVLTMVVNAHGRGRHGEIARLRSGIDSARRLLASGRHRPGERIVRQAMHALARRGEWRLACEGAGVLARTLLTRGRLAEADAVLDGARQWATQSRELGALQELAIIRAGVRTESGRLSEAEAVLETVLASAASAGTGLTVEATLAMVRCLNWQGRYTEAFQRLALVHPEADVLPRDAVRLRVARSRTWLGRGRAAEAVADAAHARDAAVQLDDPALSGAALYACALAQLAAGDSVQGDAAAALAVGLPPCAQSAAGHPRPCAARRIAAARGSAAGNAAGAADGQGQIVHAAGHGAGADESVARCAQRREPNRGRGAACGCDRAVRPAPVPPLPPSSTQWAAPAADNIVELMRCCQVAAEDTAVLAAVCARLRVRLQAAGVASSGSIGPRSSVWLAVAEARGGSARRMLTANQWCCRPRGERVEAGCHAVARAGGGGVRCHMDRRIHLAGCRRFGPALHRSDRRRAGGFSRGGQAVKPIGSRVHRSCSASVTAIAEVRASIEKAAAAPFAALVEGESGSGKGSWPHR